MSISILNRGASGGLTARIIVSGLSEADTVTASNGSNTKNGVWNAEDNCHEITKIKELGTWTVTATNGTYTKMQDVLVEVIGLYEIEVSYFDPVFANNSWSDIICACEANDVPTTWAVGNQKAMTINGTSYNIDIIGKNHDVYSDGNGYAPLTFQFHDLYDDGDIKMNPSGSNSGGWGACYVRTTTLPSILGLMPNEVQVGIKAVDKKFAVNASTINTVSDKLFLLAETEIFNAAGNSIGGEGTQYAYYANGGSKIKNRNSRPAGWWLRSRYKSNSKGFVCILGSGSSNYTGADTESCVAPAFCF